AGRESSVYDGCDTVGLRGGCCQGKKHPYGKSEAKVRFRDVWGARFSFEGTPHSLNMVTNLSNGRFPFGGEAMRSGMNMRVGLLLAVLLVGAGTASSAEPLSA